MMSQLKWVQSKFGQMSYLIGMFFLFFVFSVDQADFLTDLR